MVIFDLGNGGFVFAQGLFKPLIDIENSDKLPLGVIQEDFIAQTEVQLNLGDVLVLYTDGIPEARDINKAQYGLERLRQAIVENRLRSAAEIREAVIDDVWQYIGTQKVFDDITLVVMKQK